MRIALLFPSWKIANPYPPLGLAYIAAALENACHDVRIFDLSLSKNWRSVNGCLKSVEDFGPEMVGVSVMSHSYETALDLTEAVKRRVPVPVVFGGPHPTVMPEEVLQNHCVDFVIMGEAEETFVKLCAAFETQRYHDIEGLGYKRAGNIIINERREYIQDLDSLAFPARHLLELKRYRLEDDFGNPMATVLSTRGCPYECTYCYKGLFGKAYRQRSAKNIVDEIKICRDHFGYRSFYFIDDLFTLNIRRLRQLMNKITENDLGIKWQCLARVDNASAELYREMKRSGCFKIHFGLESANQTILNRIKKNIRLDQAEKAIFYCKEAGIKAKGYFMIGLPGDTMETMKQTIDFAANLALDEVMFSICTPFPGTEIWYDLRDKIDHDFSSAFYYPPSSNDLNIFYNLSDAKNEEVVDIFNRSRILFDSRRIKWCKRLGTKLGECVYYFLKRIPN